MVILKETNLLLWYLSICVIFSNCLCPLFLFLFPIHISLYLWSFKLLYFYCTPCWLIFHHVHLSYFPFKKNTSRQRYENISEFSKTAKRWWLQQADLHNLKYNYKLLGEFIVTFHINRIIIISVIYLSRLKFIEIHKTALRNSSALDVGVFVPWFS